MEEVRMRHKQRLEVGGCRVTLTEAPGRPLMLFTRMASGETGIWDPIWPFFAERFRVATFELIDQAGFGRLDSPAEAFRQLASACVEVAAGLGHDRFHLFGWFGGTQVALRCLVDHGPRVASAILLNPFYQFPDMRKVEKALEFKRIIYEHGDRELYSFYWLMAGFTPEFLERRFDVVETLAHARAGRDRLIKSDVEQWMKWVRALRANWLTDGELARIAAPTLVIGTELDNWHAGPTADMARAVASRIPSARLEILARAGAFIFIEDPERFARTVRPFLEEVRAR